MVDEPSMAGWCACVRVSPIRHYARAPHDVYGLCSKHHTVLGMYALYTSMYECAKLQKKKNDNIMPCVCCSCCKCLSAC